MPPTHLTASISAEDLLGPVVTAMSAEASDMSSYLLMGLPGLAYIVGLAEVTWTAIGLSIGTYLNFPFVARLLRRYSEKIGAFTIPDFYSRRYKDERHLLSCIAAVIILIFFIPYTASGFKAVGTMFNSLFGFDYHVAMIIGAIIIIAYTTMGGFGGRIHYGPCAEHLYVGRPDHHRILWHRQGRRS